MLNKVKGVSRLRYTVDFARGLNAKNGIFASGAEVTDGVLRSTNAFAPVNQQTEEEFIGFGGATESFLCVVSRNKAFRFDKKLLRKAFDMDDDCVSYTRLVGRSCVYVSPDSGGLWRVDKQQAADMGGLDYAGLAYVNERVAGLALGSRIYFGATGTDKLATNSSATRNIVLQSNCQGLACVSNNVVYALGPTCYKLIFNADNENIQALKIAQGLDDVVSQTVAVMGSTVIFATARGLYALKNDKITRIFAKGGGIADDFTDCRACVWRGKYVLTNVGGQALSYALDVDTQSCCCVLPQGLIDIADFQGETYAVFQDGKLYKMQKNAYSDMVYAVSDVDFNRTQAKYLRRINVQTRYDVQLRLSSDEEMRLLTVKGKRALQSITVFLKGSSFSLEIRSSGQAELKKLEITADVYEEDKYGS